MLFKSAYTKFLEAELIRVRTEHKETLTELKSAHAEELNRANLLTEQLRDEVDRLRKYLFPGMLTAKETAVVDSSPSPPPTSEEIGGTPFQRVARRVLEEEEKRFNAAEQVKQELRKKAAEAAIAEAYQPAESGGQGPVPPS